MSLFPRRQKKSVNMTSGPVLRQIIAFGIPILIGSIFQQLYSMVDSIVVGNFVGADALAAVGSASTVSWCLVMLAGGLTTGASVVVAQLFGAGRQDQIRRAISTSLIFAVAVSLVITVLGWFGAPWIMSLVRVPEALMRDSILYLKIYSAGAVFLMIYNFYAAVLRALGDSTTPLIFLAVSSVLNIAGDLYFVLSLHLNVPGVALATVLSQAVSAILCAVYSRMKMDWFRFGKGEFRFYKDLFGDILRMSVPSALQSSVSNLGFVAVQGLINSYGAACMAAYTAASKMEGLSHLPIEGFAMALGVFVGQNIGAGDTQRVRQGLRKTSIFCAAICAVTAGVIFAIGPALIRLFVSDAEAEIIAMGAAFMRKWAPFIVFFMLMMCLSSTLRGAGDSVFAMVISFTDLGVRTFMAYFLAKTCGFGFMGIAYSIFIGWASAALIGFIRYLTGRWKTMKISSAG